MHYRFVSLVTAVIVMLCLDTAIAQGPIVYPAKGQSAEQTSRDKQACSQWAQQQGSAYHASAGPAPEMVDPSGGYVRSGLRGAALGAVGGAIGGNAAKGAAIGAGVFGAGRLLHNREAARYNYEQQEEWQQRQAQAQQAAQLNFDRAFAACMKGRGYSVD